MIFTYYTFIINLDEREDRLKDTIEECNRIGISEYTRFSAIKPKTLNRLINPLKTWKNDINYLLGSLGCKMSHLEVLRRSMKVDSKLILILEDDVVFEDDTQTYITSSMQSLTDIDWDILYLSVNLESEKDATLIKDNLLKIHKGLTTTALIFNKKNIQKIIKIIMNSEKEIDNTYNNGLLNNYCVYPMCVYQRESYSDIINKDINYGRFHKKFIY